MFSPDMDQDLKIMGCLAEVVTLSASLMLTLVGLPIQYSASNANCRRHWTLSFVILLQLLPQKTPHLTASIIGAEKISLRRQGQPADSVSSDVGYEHLNREAKPCNCLCMHLAMKNATCYA